MRSSVVSLGSGCHLDIWELFGLASDPTDGIVEIAGGGSPFGKCPLLNLCDLMLHGILHRSCGIAQDSVEFISLDLFGDLLQLTLELF
jgi:hypothetical protein